RARVRPQGLVECGDRAGTAACQRAGGFAGRGGRFVGSRGGVVVQDYVTYNHLVAVIVGAFVALVYLLAGNQRLRERLDAVEAALASIGVDAGAFDVSGEPYDIDDDDMEGDD